PWGGFTNFQCHPYDDFPYVENFATGGQWRFINGDLTNQWVWGEAGVRNDPHIYISDNDGTSNHYTINSAAMVYATKLFHFEEGGYRFQYDWLAYGEKNWDYLRVALVPASVELSASTSVPSGFSYQGLPTGWIALDGGAQLNQNTWWQTTISEIEVPTGDYLMVFAWRNDNSVGTQPPAAIDNVSITPITCLAPAELTAQYVGATQVILDWTPSGNEDEWRVWLSWENGNETLYVPYTANTHPFTLTGLTAGRTYTANVYAVCGPDDASMPSNEISFTTSTNPCDDPISLPFTENFDGYTGSTSPSVNVLPDCWSRINTTTASYYSGYPRVTEFSSYAHSGPNFLYFMSNYDSDPQDQYAILPPVDHTANLVLSLYARIPAAGRNGTFMVGVMTDPSDASTFTELASYQPTSTTYTYYSIPLGLYTGDGTYIAIKMPAASSEVNYRGVCIDDIAIEPLCNPEDQCNLTFTLTDSYGDGWNGNAINVVDVETGVILASMTNVTNDHANAPITEAYTLPVCDGRELRFEWVKGNWATECSYTITNANGEVILQGTGSDSMNTGDELGTYMVNCSAIAQTIALTAGWNWVSTYIDADEVDCLAMLEASLGDYGVSIATSNDIAEYLGDGFWLGLEGYQWTNSELIMVEVSEDCTVTLEGPAVDLGTVSITINPGWNWIGFPMDSEMSIDEALANFEPEFGDGIASYGGITEYIGIWTGDFETLVPGQGYMYYSASEEPKVLSFIQHEYVDLGLPSGLLWATCNVGATAPEDFGDYFAWGETQPKNIYDWTTYQYYNGNILTKYTGSDGLTILELCDDAAAANWGSGWRMPTEEELQELYDNTTHVWTTQNGVYGRLFTANNGNSLFLPAAGYRYDSSLYIVGDHGYYWSSSLYSDSYNAWGSYLGSGDYGTGNSVRSSGFNVRPVCSSGQK
ncbi:MAG: choice-of-anchor J domain-containing protein, partial [Muribaculaceae bacterium]|nr:choice-of-anchor J domain-containing protein [Muribaculaceae bacterium]